MAEESPRVKALSAYLVESPHDSDRKWAEYVALAPDLAGFKPATTVDDLSPGARRCYDYLVGASTELDPIHDAGDIGAADLAASAHTTYLVECPSHDADVPASVLIPSATPNSSTTTGGVVPELAAPEVSDKALDVDVTSNSAAVQLDTPSSPVLAVAESAATMLAPNAGTAMVREDGQNIEAPGCTFGIATNQHTGIKRPPWTPPRYASFQEGNMCKDMPHALVLNGFVLGSTQLMLLAGKNPWPPPSPNRSTTCRKSNLHGTDGYLGSTNWALGEEQGQVLMSMPWSPFKCCWVTSYPVLFWNLSIGQPHQDLHGYDGNSILHWTSFSDENQLHVLVALGTFWCELFSIGNTWDCLQYEYLQQWRPPDAVISLAWMSSDINVLGAPTLESGNQLECVCYFLGTYDQEVLHYCIRAVGVQLQWGCPKTSCLPFHKGYLHVMSEHLPSTLLLEFCCQSSQEDGDSTRVVTKEHVVHPFSHDYSGVFFVVRCITHKTLALSIGWDSRSMGCSTRMNEIVSTQLLAVYNMLSRLHSNQFPLELFGIKHWLIQWDPGKVRVQRLLSITRPQAPFPVSRPVGPDCWLEALFGRHITETFMKHNWPTPSDQNQELLTIGTLLGKMKLMRITVLWQAQRKWKFKERIKVVKAPIHLQLEQFRMAKSAAMVYMFSYAATMCHHFSRIEEGQLTVRFLAACVAMLQTTSFYSTRLSSWEDAMLVVNQWISCPILGDWILFCPTQEAFLSSFENFQLVNAGSVGMALVNGNHVLLRASIPDPVTTWSCDQFVTKGATYSEWQIPWYNCPCNAISRSDWLRAEAQICYYDHYIDAFLDRVSVSHDYYINLAQIHSNHFYDISFHYHYDLGNVKDSHVPWDPDGSTFHRLGVKPIFMEGGLSATLSILSLGRTVGYQLLGLGLPEYTKDYK